TSPRSPRGRAASAEDDGSRELNRSRSLVWLPGYTRTLDAGRAGTAAPPRPGADRGGARPHHRAACARAEPLRARRLLTALVGALRVQALCPPARAPSCPRRTGLAGPR